MSVNFYLNLILFLPSPLQYKFLVHYRNSCCNLVFFFLSRRWPKHSAGLNSRKAVSVRIRERNMINRERARQVSRIFSTLYLSAEAKDELVAGGEEAADIRPAVQATEEEVTQLTSSG